MILSPRMSIAHSPRHISRRKFPRPIVRTFFPQPPCELSAVRAQDGSADQGPSLAQLAETPGGGGETLPEAPKLAVSRAAPGLPERRAASNGLLKRARKHYGTRLVCTALADNRQVTEARSDAADDPG